jgi:WD40 repeat protein
MFKTPVRLSQALAAAALALPLSLSSQGLGRAQVESTPSLQIEVGAHSAAIRRIAVDPARNRVVTAASDRTARVWSLETGQMLQVLRPPVSGTRGGQLYGAALHPDGLTVAVAGTSGDMPSASHSIYLFDIETGRIKKRFESLAGEIKRLAWSPDGTVLMAALAGANGLKAYSLDGSLLFEHAFRSPSYGLSVLPSGLVAGASLSGEVALLQAQAGSVKLLRRFMTKTPQPVGISLSPDGRRFLLGSYDFARADIYDSESGELLREVRHPDSRPGNLQTVEWSSDGKSIYLAGTKQLGKLDFIIARFSVDSGLKTEEFVAASNTINDMASLADGRVAFASSDGSWGMFSGSKITRFNSNAIAPVQEAKQISMNLDGSRVRWQVGLASTMFEFDLQQRTISNVSQPAQLAITPSIDFWEDATRDVWENKNQLKVSGNQVPLDAGEIARSRTNVGKSSDRLYGTSTHLIRVRSNGELVWRRAIDSEARAILVNADGSQAISAMQDGTIRWWRTSDGELLLTLLASTDKRWIIWSPKGFFDSSAGGDRFAGWTVSSSADKESEFFTLNRFRDPYNRPDIIDQIIRTGDPKLAIAAADQIAAKQNDLNLTVPLAASQIPAPMVVPPVAAPPVAVPPIAVPPVAVPPVALPPVVAPPVGVPPVAAPPVGVPPVAAPPVALPPVAAPSVPSTTTIAKAPLPSPQVIAPPVTAPVIEVPSVLRAPSALPGTTPLPADVKPPLAAQASASQLPVLPTRVTPADPPKVSEMPPTLTRIGNRALKFSGDELILPFTIRTQGALLPATTVEVRINGRPFEPTAIEMPKSLDGDSKGQARLKFDDPEAIVQLFARNKNGVSEPLDFQIERAKPVVPPKPRMPTLYVLAIGVSEYRQGSEIEDLRFASKDANDFAAVVRTQIGRLYGDVVVKVLRDSGATRAETLKNLKWLAESAAPNDLAFLFLAGHGTNESGGQYFFLPHDANVKSLRTTAVSEVDIRDSLRRIRGRAIFFVDTCFSGQVMGSNPNANREMSRLANDLAATENGVIVFAASTGRQKSLEADGNGYFTKALIDGLNGAADFQKRGRVTYKQLDAYLSDEVSRSTKGRQTPVTNIPVGIADFEIARFPGNTAHFNAGRYQATAFLNRLTEDDSFSTNMNSRMPFN